MIAPKLKKAASLPKNFPLTSSGIRSAFNARDAGIAMLWPNARNIVIPAAEMRSLAKGKVIVASLDGRLPSAMMGLLPILSESLPAKRLQVNPTKPASDSMIPIWNGEALKKSPKYNALIGLMKL